jgi:hypothetical protein
MRKALGAPPLGFARGALSLSKGGKRCGANRGRSTLGSRQTFASRTALNLADPLTLLAFFS